jgi:uncharacterized protein YjdB
MNERRGNPHREERTARRSRSGAVRNFALAAVLIATLVIAPEYSLLNPARAHAAPKFTATAPKPGLSTIYVKKGASIAIKGRYLAKGDKVTSYKSSKPSVATISKKGKLKAKKTGKTTITLRTKKGKKDTIKVVVVKKSTPAKSITINNAKTIKVNQVVRLSVKTKPTKSTSTVKWTSSDKKIATVDAAGYITGKKAGEVEIKVRTSSRKTASCKLTVKDPVTISKTSATAYVGQPDKLKLTASAPSGTILWSSSDDSVATVKDGVVTPKKIGVADIIATTKVSGTTAACRVTVTDRVKAKGITVSPEKDSIYAGKTTTLKATLISAVDGKASNDRITWSSSNEKVAKVSATGVVTGVAYGKATITATAESGPKAAAEITVHTVKTGENKVILTPGMKYKLPLTFYGSGSSKGVVYSSGDKSIASVDSSGYVSVNLRDKATGKAKEGEVVITAKTKGGEKATVKIIVRDEPTIIDVSKWQGAIDWATASKSVDLAILRVIYGADTSLEGKYRSYADDCKKYGVPFGVYAYVKYKSKKEAENEAAKFYEQAVSGGRAPLFFVVDIEESHLTRANTEAYIAKLRSLAKEDGIERLKIGVYIGHHLYETMKLNVTPDKKNAKTPDFVWIPRYNTNVGARTEAMYEPKYVCDMWQYTSTGGVPGIVGNVDMNTLTDTRGKWLTDKPDFDFDWLIAGAEAK